MQDKETAPGSATCGFCLKWSALKSPGFGTEELPERAVAPVLFVGDHRLTESEPAGFRKYRFFAFDSTALKEDAPISLGWDVAQSPRSETGVRYKLQPE